jgi:hypothetical protein
MEVFFVFTLLLIALHLCGIAAIIKYLSGVRNLAGLMVGFVSAYVFSIALDSIWAHCIGTEPLVIVPIIAGVVYGVGFYFAARKLVTRAIAARFAYFSIGLLALFAGFVGHRHTLPWPPQCWSCRSSCRLIITSTQPASRRPELESVDETT